MTRKSNSSDVRGLGDVLLGGAQMPESEIVQMVADPRLFARILSDIERQRVAGHREVPSRWSPLLQWQTAVRFGMAGVALGLITALLVSVSSISDAEVANVPAVAGTDLSPPIIDRDPVQPPIVTVAAGKRERRSVSRSKIARPVSSSVDTDQTPFVQVAFTGELNDESDRIIRVELPRASLFAMGVIIPVENEGDKAKADLLLASDGTVKGVRLAKL